MPDCPPKTDEQRKRWENIVGKALKSWTTALMGFGMTREEARGVVLSEIELQTTLVGARLREQKKEQPNPTQPLNSESSAFRCLL